MSSLGSRQVAERMLRQGACDELVERVAGVELDEIVGLRAEFATEPERSFRTSQPAMRGLSYR